MDTAYWNGRYESGAGAGSGSRGRLAEFKLEVVQGLVDKYKVESVVDVGCGDGGQLSELSVKSYLGLDPSPVAVDKACLYRVDTDASSWEYEVFSEEIVMSGNAHDMAISLDVLMHLDEEAYRKHVEMLFHLSKRYVLIYAPNRLANGMKLAPHMFFREWVGEIKDHFGIDPIEHVPNKYPAKDNSSSRNDVSFSEFYLFDIPSKKKKDKK